MVLLCDGQTPEGQRTMIVAGHIVVKPEQHESFAITADLVDPGRTSSRVTRITAGVIARCWPPHAGSAATAAS
jgi:hypothetical protein